jgi:hypothetical protein
MSQPWPEPNDRRFPVRIRVNVWNGRLCGADGDLRRWLDDVAGRHGYALTPAGVRGRDVYYIMLSSFTLARLLLDDWAGQIAIDILPETGDQSLALDSDDIGIPRSPQTRSVAPSR